LTAAVDENKQPHKIHPSNSKNGNEEAPQADKVPTKTEEEEKKTV